MDPLRIGVAGLDTSHVTAFATLLHDSANAHYVPGARIAAAFPGGSPDFELSIGRVDQFTGVLKDQHGVELVSSISALEGKCDAVMLLSIDGRVHADQFREVAEWGLPVFIDKPLAVSAEDAREIADIAEAKNVRVTSSSAMRFAEKFREALELDAEDPIIGFDVYGPMGFVDKSPGYFWYGVHSVDMLFACLGTGCQSVMAVREGLHDVLVGRWSDGRIGMVRGNRAGNGIFGGTIHRKTRSAAFDVSSGGTPVYASLLKKVIPFLSGTGEVVPLPEMVEVIKFLEAANQSVAVGKWMDLG